MSPLPQQETFYDAYEIEISDQINAFPPVPQDDVYDEAWSIRVDELFLKIDRVEEDLVTVESAIRTASTQCLRGVTYNLQDQQHIDNVIDTLLCRLDALDIPQQAVFMRSQRKQLVKRIEGLTVAVPSVSSLSSSSSKKKKKSTTTRRVVSSSTCTPTKKEKRLAANAWAKQWSVKVFGK
ncbi:hypothetical protein FRACYDRAFT_232337 [Fragilariopsis cylindrus CCMP1102]|uniref:BAG domain-containing protein n=1 Tax=Fragilariopsis cylindrus CCMP1102 TaxID=635003 RepID=A0A1E7FWK8_9STRA|nr:hypothetical protein FRACYDRAFT_232337 [Fragilariopsis cylindrus CCMP1102]|eukprot:OEU22183.1 hypothetical protein FRACYDRAFT_232337 [Fragilariopsis cylindrus CCMP1102]